MQNHPKLVHKHLSLMANGVIDLLPHHPFPVLLSYFGDKTVTVPENALFGLGLLVLKGILTIGVNTIRAEAAGDNSCLDEDKSISHVVENEVKPDSE